ncbi:PAS domain-containing sensor histidine kinase [Metabacillus litoralis]|uniref:PAS domain-containing sensor histidine kinase n=1 Tax=Metabacillus litoralis TaxID=152268 RepID=UPI0027D7F9DF|nr:PAS domain-containing sensor histidine kinase [Metabacillus litoralis]
MKQTMEDREIVALKAQLAQVEKENEMLKFKLLQHENILEGALDAVAIFDENMRFIDVNSAACHMFQLQKKELCKRNLYDFLSLIPSNQIRQVIDDIYHDDPVRKELIVKLDNGQVKFLEISLRKKAINGYDLAMIKDVSFKKMLERERTINEQLFKDLFHRAVDGIVIFDQNGDFIDANGSFCASFEITKMQLNSFGLEDFIDKHEKYRLDNLWKMLKENGSAKGELPVILKNGSKKIFEFTTTSNIIDGFYMAIMRDITEKRSMEIQLYKSEERFREVFENAIDAIMIWDKHGQIMKVNQAASRTFELNETELVRRNILDFVDQTSPSFLKVKNEYFNTGAIREELLFHMPNGQNKELEFTSKMDILDGHHLTIFRNVSERKRMEKILRESEHKFRSIFDGAMDGIILFNHSFEIIEANETAKKILNLKSEDIKSSRICDILFSHAHADPEYKTLESYEENIQEIMYTNENGEEMILEIALKNHINENMNLAVFRDVTEKRELEEQLRKSDTLNVVGELAAGIAHEIRNPMTALKGFIQLLEGSVKEDFSMYFNVITSELSRIESIITEFLILARPQAIQYSNKDIGTIVKETMELLNAQAILVNVQMQLNIEENLPLLFCEPNQLKQVFINVLKNAIEVMPDGGQIDVTVKRKNEDQLLISIRDRGSGISQDKIKRLGQPFYTTKERGTGLGLMVSYKIIEEHQGQVEVESEEGKGTTFHITLPITQ